MNILSKRFALPVAAAIIVSCLIGLLIGFFFGQSHTVKAYAATADTKIASDIADEPLLTSAFDALALIKAQDFKALADCIHPDGVILSPYATVDPDKNLCFSASEVRGFSADTSKYNWGIDQTTGAAIELTPTQYFQKYILANDYLNAPIIGRNRVVGVGNTLDNVSEAFPDGSYIEFYIPGANGTYESVAWKSLKLVFKPYEDELRLAAIICGEWTI